MPWIPSEKKTHTNKDWFEENINVLLPLIKSDKLTLSISMTEVA